MELETGEARKPDRASALVRRPAGAPAGEAGDAAREARPGRGSAGPYPVLDISIRKRDGARAQLRAECAHGMAIVPCRERRNRMMWEMTRSARPGAYVDSGMTDEAHVTVERSETETGFTLYHVRSGLRLLPEGWFFTSIGDAREGVAAIAAVLGDALETPDINAVAQRSGPALEALRPTGVIAGRWNDLSRALDGFDEKAWEAGAADRAERMRMLKDDPNNSRRNAA
ncbi:hypothetical protein [Hoeflea sp.]|uniref:hypothetical protein n=1 Tax=Hoeflea sp. TaxID=1940281 RepID=UPI003B527984